MEQGPSVRDIFPGGHMGKVPVVAERLAKRRLMFFAKMRSARFFAMQRVIAKQLGTCEKIGHPTRIFQCLIECCPGSKDRYLVPELLAQGRNGFERLLEARFLAGHPAQIPHQASQATMV